MSDTDIPINKAILMGAGIIAGAFAFFNLASCTKSFIATPDYVQALQACRDFTHVQVRMPLEDDRVENADGKAANGTYRVLIALTPEVVAAVEKCQEVVKENFTGKSLKPLPATVKKPFMHWYNGYWVEAPPPEYAHPYTGEIIFMDMPNDRLQIVCRSGLKSGEVAHACTLPMGNRCIIYWPEGKAKAGPLLWHEEAHCNGWRH